MLLPLLFLLIAPAHTADPGVEWARVVQEQLPRWQSRRDSALARVRAAEDYFEGRRSLGEAFPDLDGAPLDSLAWLSGRLEQLDAAGAARAAERYAALPELQAAWQDQQRRQALEAALDAEDRAAALERRLLLGLRQILLEHPELRREALEEILAPLRARVAAADAVSEEAGAEALAAARADALAAGGELRRFEALLDGIRHAATARSPPPDYRPDLERLTDPEEGPYAQQRLELLLPFLRPAEAEAVERALIAAVVDVQLPELRAAISEARAELERSAADGERVEHAPIDELEAAVAERARQVDEARARLLELARAPQSALTKSRQQRASLLLELAQVRLAAAAQELERALDSSRRALEAAEETRAEAAAARQEGDGQSALRGELLEILAGAQARTAELSAAQEGARAKRDKIIASTEAALQTIEADVTDARAMSGALQASERRRKLDKAYRDLRRELSLLRAAAREADTEQRAARDAAGALPGSLAAERARIREIREVLGAATTHGGRDPEDIAAAWEEERQRWEALLAENVADAQAYRDELVHLLHRARELRRELRPEVSLEVLDEDRAQLLDDLRQELALLGPGLATAARDRVEWIRRLPGRMLHLSALSTALLGSVWILVVALIWSYARRRSAGGIRWGLERWAERAGAPYSRAELQAVEELATPVAVALIDLGMGYTLYEPVRDDFAELGLVLLVYLQVATYRLLMGLFDLLVASYPSLRPALLTLHQEPRSHARRILRVLLLWTIVSHFTSYLTLEILDADALGDLLSVLFDWVFLAILAWTLHFLEPDIRAVLARQASASRFQAILSTPPHYIIERIPRALVGGVLLLGRALFHLADVRATDRSGLGRLLNYINRRQLSTSEQASAAPPVSSRLQSLLTKEACPDEYFVERPAAAEAFASALSGWMAERRAGRAVLIGDRGDGKGCWLDRRCAELERAGWPISRYRLDRRLSREQDAVRWLGRRVVEAGHTGAPPSDVGALIEALLELPGRIWIIQDLERAFLRSVGGFQAIQALFHVIQQCGEHHFWILGVHRPAWHYLSRLSALFDTHFFRAEIDLEPLREEQLRELIRLRMAGSGVRADFRRLERPGPAGARSEAERDRAERTYFRLLSEASQGNAAVALRCWVDCLTPGETEGVVEVRLPGLGEELSGLSDVDLFVLTAVRLQDELRDGELSEVLNIAPAVIVAAVRSLIDRQLLEARSGGVGIPIRQLPKVTRLLRRRHFLQGIV